MTQDFETFSAWLDGEGEAPLEFHKEDRKLLEELGEVLRHPPLPPDFARGTAATILEPPRPGLGLRHMKRAKDLVGPLLDRRMQAARPDKKWVLGALAAFGVPGGWMLRYWPEGLAIYGGVAVLGSLLVLFLYHTFQGVSQFTALQRGRALEEVMSTGVRPDRLVDGLAWYQTRSALIAYFPLAIILAPVAISLNRGGWVLGSIPILGLVTAAATYLMGGLAMSRGKFLFQAWAVFWLPALLLALIHPGLALVSLVGGLGWSSREEMIAALGRTDLGSSTAARPPNPFIKGWNDDPLVVRERTRQSRRYSGGLKSAVGRQLLGWLPLALPLTCFARDTYHNNFIWLTIVYWLLCFVRGAWPALEVIQRERSSKSFDLLLQSPMTAGEYLTSLTHLMLWPRWSEFLAGASLVGLGLTIAPNAIGLEHKLLGPVFGVLFAAVACLSTRAGILTGLHLSASQPDLATARTRMIPILGLMVGAAAVLWGLAYTFGMNAILGSSGSTWGLYNDLTHFFTDLSPGLCAVMVLLGFHRWAQSAGNRSAERTWSLRWNGSEKPARLRALPGWALSLLSAANLAWLVCSEEYARSFQPGSTVMIQGLEMLVLFLLMLLGAATAHELGRGRSPILGLLSGGLSALVFLNLRGHLCQIAAITLEVSTTLSLLICATTVLGSWALGYFASGPDQRNSTTHLALTLLMLAGVVGLGLGETVPSPKPSPPVFDSPKDRAPLTNAKLTKVFLENRKSGELEHTEALKLLDEVKDVWARESYSPLKLKQFEARTGVWRIVVSVFEGPTDPEQRLDAFEFGLNWFETETRMPDFENYLDALYRSGLLCFRLRENTDLKGFSEAELVRLEELLGRFQPSEETFRRKVDEELDRLVAEIDYRIHFYPSPDFRPLPPLPRVYYQYLRYRWTRVLGEQRSAYLDPMAQTIPLEPSLIGAGFYQSLELSRDFRSSKRAFRAFHTNLIILRAEVDRERARRAGREVPTRVDLTRFPGGRYAYPIYYHEGQPKAVWPEEL